MGSEGIWQEKVLFLLKARKLELQEMQDKILSKTCFYVGGFRDGRELSMSGRPGKSR